MIDVLVTALGWSPTVAEQRAHSITYTFGPFTSYRLIPKKILVKGGDPIHINRRGFRGAEIVGKKKPGNSRIVILGGSQVFDYNGGDWPAMLGEELRRRGHDVDVINAGVPGHDTTRSLVKLLTDIWTLEPDVIVLCQAWNDIKYR